MDIEQIEDTNLWIHGELRIIDRNYAELAAMRAWELAMEAWQKASQALAELNEIPTPNDGRTPQLRVTSDYIQWKYTDDITWNNLVALSSLQGPEGKSTYQVAVANGFSGSAMDWLLSIRGQDGKQIQLQKTTTAIQWRLEGGTWVDLVTLAELKGADGKRIQLQKGSAAIQYRYEGDSTWTDLVTLTEIKGSDGKSVQLQKTTDYIQWRNTGDLSWINLVALLDLKGDPGIANVKLSLGIATVATSLIMLAGATQDITVTLSPAMPDANYTTANPGIILTGASINILGQITASIITKNAGSVVVRIKNTALVSVNLVGIQIEVIAIKITA